MKPNKGIVSSFEKTFFYIWDALFQVSKNPRNQQSRKNEILKACFPANVALLFRFLAPIQSIDCTNNSNLCRLPLDEGFVSSVSISKG
jgi:hypothetical protein